MKISNLFESKDDKAFFNIYITAPSRQARARKDIVVGFNISGSKRKTRKVMDGNWIGTPYTTTDISYDVDELEQFKVASIDLDKIVKLPTLQDRENVVTYYIKKLFDAQIPIKCLMLDATLNLGKDVPKEQLQKALKRAEVGPAIRELCELWNTIR